MRLKQLPSLGNRRVSSEAMNEEVEPSVMTSSSSSISEHAEDKTELSPQLRDPYYCLHKNIECRKNALGKGLYVKAPIAAGSVCSTLQQGLGI